MGEAIGAQFFAAYEQVGRFTALQAVRHGPGRATYVKQPAPAKYPPMLQKLGGNVVSYFCTPDKQVLFFTVGPVAPETLLAAAKWAESAFGRLAHADVTTADECQVQQREAHLRAAHVFCKEAFEQLYPSRWRAGKAPPPMGPDEFTRLIDAAQQACARAQQRFVQERLAILFPDKSPYHPWTGQPIDYEREVARYQAEYQQLALSATAGNVAHLVLCELPLAKVAQVQQVVFERLAGQVFAPRTPRSDMLLEAVQQVRSEKTPMLLVIGDATGRAREEVRISGQPLALLKSKAVRELIGQVQTLELTLQELTILLDDLDEPPLPGGHGIIPRFAIFNASGRLVATLGDRAMASDLAAALERTLAINSAKKDTDKETLAARELELANRLLDENRPAAERRMRQLKQKYPGTAAARDAAKLLVR